MLKQIQTARDALKAAAPFIETARLAADALRRHREEATRSEFELDRAYRHRLALFEAARCR